MNFNNSFTLKTFSDSAEKQFNEMQSRLEKIEGSFQTRMDGRTTGGLVGAFIGTMFWCAALIALFVFLRGRVNDILLLVTAGASLALLLAMLIDHIMSFAYYGKIAKYKTAVSQLRSRVAVGKNSIKANYDTFMGTRKRGWDYRLSPAPSIPEKATSLVSTMTNMESLKGGFINGAKNFFFYVVVIMITIVGGVALFQIGGQIMTGISGESLSEDTIQILNIVALAIVGIGEVILAKLVWSKTDCKVTNVTLLILAVGPAAFLALIAIATALVMLVVGLVSLVISIIGIVIVCVLAYACLCGN